jgi:hypothetical protein
VPYTPDKPKLNPSTEELRTSVPGWGVDLDPRDRPAVPKENFDMQATGAHWTFPERQIPRYRRERSIEHKFLTPVFGTVCPPKGLSGIVRRIAYRYFSEGRTAHWTLLVLADRIDVMESSVTALLRGRPDNPFAEIGLVAERKAHGLRSRRGQHRSDWKHLPVDPIMFAAKTALTLAAVWPLVRLVTRGRRRARARWWNLLAAMR